jgi:hypothetical protein
VSLPADERRPCRRTRCRWLRDQQGSAIVELVWLAVLLLLPLVYVIVTIASVQRSTYGATEAVRGAARAYVLSPDVSTARERALAAARLAMRDQGVEISPSNLTLTCQPTPQSCLQPGSTVEARLSLSVRLPLAPSVFGRVAGSIAVNASHTDVVGTYRDAPDEAR